ncbi:hypothetical protein V6N13_004595 [Hibiscus sabdariffa]|uniref:Uncharacterized protein n=1 Tax=Hibiscus sabdariffa TaxID=183260 RepID=A0ABR2RYZ6_9ROSI
MVGYLTFSAGDRICSANGLVVSGFCLLHAKAQAHAVSWLVVILTSPYGTRRCSVAFKREYAAVCQGIWQFPHAKTCPCWLVAGESWGFSRIWTFPMHPLPCVVRFVTGNVEKIAPFSTSIFPQSTVRSQKNSPISG